MILNAQISKDIALFIEIHAACMLTPNDFEIILNSSICKTGRILDILHLKKLKFTI